MDEMQTLLNEVMRKQTAPALMLARIVSNKLKAKGIKCSDAQSLVIGRRIAEGLRLGGDGENSSTITIADGKKTRRKVDLELTAEDIEKYAEDFGASVAKQVMPLADKLAKLYLSSVSRRDYEGMRLRRGDMERFRKNLRTRWGRAFESYERFLAVATDAGSAANTYLRSGKAGKPGALVEAMSRVHARACHVAGEVLALLESGYADGAHARWRTLHELAVVAAVLSEHDDDLAERYLHHEVVESHKAAVQFNEHAGDLGEKPLSKREMQELASQERALRERYGADYAKRYGWAAKVLNNSNPNFDQLERAASVKHLRPYYKLASYNAHATPKGINYRLGLRGPSSEILLAGPSNAGLEEAGRFAAHSLLTTTLCLLTIRTTLDSLVFGKMLLALFDDVERKFIRAAARLEADEARFGRPRGRVHSGQGQ
jgi:hypothetical protein